MPQPLFSVLRVLILLAASALLLFCTSAYQVYRLAATDTTPQYADAAVVLGAAAWGNKPSPVFRERISHGIDLYRRGLVGKLIFTGGTRKAGYPTEAEVGRRYALARGVPENDIITENLSANTYENLHNTRTLMYRHQLRGVILVSDPYHMARAAAIAADLDINAAYSPTPTSRYTGIRQNSRFFLREAAFLSLFRIWQLGKLLTGSRYPERTAAATFQAA